MDKKAANQIYKAVIGATKGHPPGDPDERLAKINELMQPWLAGRKPKERKSRGGHDRMENGGNDRQE